LPNKEMRAGTEGTHKILELLLEFSGKIEERENEERVHQCSQTLSNKEEEPCA
jgi:hypothetical protein